MCRSIVCEQIASWLHAEPVMAVIALLFIAMGLFRLAVRGRWLTIFAILASWAVAGAVIIWMLP